MARNLANGDAKRQADVFAALLRRLAAAGAELAVVSSMGGHFCIRELEAISPIPILNAIPEVAAEVERRKFKRVGILGTRMVMETRLYGAIASAAVVVPQAEAFEECIKTMPRWRAWAASRMRNDGHSSAPVRRSAGSKVRRWFCSAAPTFSGVPERRVRLPGSRLRRGPRRGDLSAIAGCRLAGKANRGGPGQAPDLAATPDLVRQDGGRRAAERLLAFPGCLLAFAAGCPCGRRRRLPP